MALRSGKDAGAAALADGRQIEYRVDAYGRRLAKLVDGTVVRKWLYAGGLLPVAELDANDNLISVFNGGFMVRDGKTYRIITDRLGSPRLVVDASTGEVAQQLTYDEWGKVTEDTNPGFQPFGFAGGLYDPDTGLVRFGARDYDPLAGRWTTKDPIRFRGGTANLYVYCGNNPVNYVDPDGLKPRFIERTRLDTTTTVVETGAKFEAHGMWYEGGVNLEDGLNNPSPSIMEVKITITNRQPFPITVTGEATVRDPDGDRGKFTINKKGQDEETYKKEPPCDDEFPSRVRGHDSGSMVLLPGQTDTMTLRDFNLRKKTWWGDVDVSVRVRTTGGTTPTLSIPGGDYRDTVRLRR